MNARGLPLSAPLSGLRVQALKWWSGLAERERRSASLAVLAVSLLLLWVVAVQPALRTVREAPAKLDQLDTELQQIQQLAAETHKLRAVPQVTPAQAAAALRSATERWGEQAQVVIQGERATLTLKGMRGDELGSWLADARSTAHAQPIEAQLVRGAEGYTGTITVRIGDPQ